ncbi:MAG: cupin domain-containing protein [Acidobacteriota bacterium]
MPFVDVLPAKRFSSEKMQKVNFFETDHLFCDLYCLLPSQSQKPHKHEGADKIYYVLEGTGTFLIGEEERVLGPETAALAESGVAHGVTNNGAANLCLLVIMAPNPNRSRPLGESQP